MMRCAANAAGESMERYGRSIVVCGVSLGANGALGALVNALHALRKLLTSLCQVSRPVSRRGAEHAEGALTRKRSQHAYAPAGLAGAASGVGAYPSIPERPRGRCHSRGLSTHHLQPHASTCLMRVPALARPALVSARRRNLEERMAHRDGYRHAGRLEASTCWGTHRDCCGDIASRPDCAATSDPPESRQSVAVRQALPASRERPRVRDHTRRTRQGHRRRRGGPAH
eukprot:6227156-Prymnesium_polylepis.2